MLSLFMQYLLIKGEMILTREGYKDAKQVDRHSVIFQEELSFFES